MASPYRKQGKFASYPANKWPIKYCKYCGKQIKKNKPYKIRRATFCCVSCKAHFCRPSAIGSTYTEKRSGRIFIKVATNRPGHRNWMFLHRYLMEQKLGRKLKEREIVHHKDGDINNNHLDNLELLNSQSDHVFEHKKKGTMRSLKNGQWSLKQNKCQKCGTTTQRHWAKGFCTRCYMSNWYKLHPRKVGLVDLIKTPPAHPNI